MNALQRGIVAILGAAVLFSCRDDEDSSPIVHDRGAGGETSTAGANSVAGAGEPPSGGAPQSEGGRPEAPSPGGEAGEGGSAGALGGAAGTAQGGEAGSPSAVGERLEVCGRLTSPTIIHIDAVTRGYTTLTLNDCNVDLLFPRNEALAGFRNRLTAWAMRFWGCQGESVTNFGLAPDDAQLSAGDAAILIDDYMASARTELGLSDPEFEDARAALERLAAPLIVDDSSEPSRSHCAAGAGGGSP